MLGDRSPLLIAAAVLLILPLGLESLGLGVTSATEVVVFAMACMALNILVGYTGLVSFGQGADGEVYAVSIDGAIYALR